MLSTVLENLKNYALAIPTNLVIIGVVCLFMVIVLKKSVGTCLRLVAGYFIIAFLLGLFGLNMPSIVTCWNWLVDKLTTLWNYIW